MANPLVLQKEPFAIVFPERRQETLDLQILPFSCCTSCCLSWTPDCLLCHVTLLFLLLLLGPLHLQIQHLVFLLSHDFLFLLLHHIKPPSSPSRLLLSADGFGELLFVDT